MKVLVVIGLSVLALAFLIAPYYFALTREWGRRFGAWYWLLWPFLAVDTGYLALMVALH